MAAFCKIYQIYSKMDQSHCQALRPTTDNAAVHSVTVGCLTAPKRFYLSVRPYRTLGLSGSSDLNICIVNAVKRLHNYC
jgi:1,4-dihydroxy-2-naphthoate octaprenyltransferase